VDRDIPGNPLEHHPEPQPLLTTGVGAAQKLIGSTSEAVGDLFYLMLARHEHNRHNRVERIRFEPLAQLRSGRKIVIGIQYDEIYDPPIERLSDFDGGLEWDDIAAFFLDKPFQ
jgi:hypothetical protein